MIFASPPPDAVFIRFTTVTSDSIVARVGSFAGALGAGEFKVRLPAQPVRYAQSLGGGVLMGYGAGIAMGCTIGAFFSSVPSLAINGWVFAAFLALGAWIGTLIIRRIA